MFNVYIKMLDFDFNKVKKRMKTKTKGPISCHCMSHFLVLSSSINEAVLPQFDLFEYLDYSSITFSYRAKYILHITKHLIDF